MASETKGKIMARCVVRNARGTPGARRVGGLAAGKLSGSCWTRLATDAWLYTGHLLAA